MDGQSQQTECAVCGNAGFDLLDGLYFCSDCGTQSQDVREELTEAATLTGGRDGAGFVRLIGSSAKKKEKTTDEDGQPIDKGSVSQLEIFQLILQKQCDAMVALGVDPSIKEAVRLLWFHYLRFYGYAFIDSQTDKSCPPRRLPVPPPPPADVDSTPKKRPAGRPKKDYPLLLSRTARRMRKDEAPKSEAELSCKDSIGKRSVASRKRSRESLGEPSSYRPKQIKVEEEEEEDREDIFDVFPSDDHLFSQDATTSGIFDAESATKLEQTSSASGSDSDEPLTGQELYVHRRREMNLLTGTSNLMWHYFSLKYTICLCYLGLLYIEHRFLLSDLVRWTHLNKVPYNNLVSVLPHSVTSNTHFRTYMSSVPLTSDRVYYLSRALHSHLKLPPLPTVDSALICHTVIDRLKLSPSFHSLLDKALLSVHRPDPFRHVSQRFDGECLALVLFLMRLVYKLDDVYEFNQPQQLLSLLASTLSGTSIDADQPGTTASGSSSSKAESLGVSTDESKPSDELSVYLWEDWVVVYIRNLRQILDESVPTNERELEYITDYRKYADFCRKEIFQATRPPPKHSSRRTVYNPDYYAKLSAIFRRYRLKVEQNAKAGIVRSESDSSCGEDAPDISITNEKEKQLPPFIPRQLSLSQMLNDPEAPWRHYQPIRGSYSHWGIRHSELADVELSQSMTFLLNAGAQLIDIQPEVLYKQLLRVEASFVDTVAKGLKKLDRFMST